LNIGPQTAKTALITLTKMLTHPSSQPNLERPRRVAALFNKTDAGNGSYGICRVIGASRSPSPDPSRSPNPTKTIEYPMTKIAALVFCNPMKHLASLTLALLMLLQSSCTTGDALARAHGEEPRWNPGFAIGQPTKGKKAPGYYVLVPFTAVYDVVSFPYWLWKLRDFHG
jgi:hypothetical protein